MCVCVSESVCDCVCDCVCVSECVTLCVSLCVCPCVCACVFQAEQKHGGTARPGGMPLVFPYVNKPVPHPTHTELYKTPPKPTKLPLVETTQQSKSETRRAPKPKKFKSTSSASNKEQDQVKAGLRLCRCLPACSPPLSPSSLSLHLFFSLLPSFPPPLLCRLC